MAGRVPGRHQKPQPSKGFAYALIRVHAGLLVGVGRWLETLAVLTEGLPRKGSESCSKVRICFLRTQQRVKSQCIRDVLPPSAGL
jgi:hypothetical protein